jgi:competence protein ComEA
MKECHRRFVLWLLALVPILFLYQSYSLSHVGWKVPFLPGRSAGQGGVTIRMDGDCVKPGIYHFKNDMSLGTVINMTVPFLQNISRDLGLCNEKLYSGDVVTVTAKKRKHVEITRDTLQVSEKMILGIPLNPNALTAGEWEKLPRIGPSLAKRIITDRQQNGDFLSIHDLERVHGIGCATVKQLEAFFSY